VLPAFAREFPSRPITLVVPFSAGGPGDVIARLLGSSMSATLKQPVVIENVVGAGDTIGTNRVAKAAPDGYTLLLMHVGQATAPALCSPYTNWVIVDVYKPQPRFVGRMCLEFS
jgi:tripartite-type tricarboxylate transporter receptor subunit TctC